jgi:hypothetical protein
MKTIKKNMEHSFNIAVAMEYGVLEAVIIRNFQYWISKNKANKSHFINDHYWTYNSISALQELFPYATTKKVRSCIDKLVEKGVLIKGHFSENPNDRTSWFAFADEGKWIVQNWQMDLPVGENGFASEGKCINEYYDDTNNNPYNKPDNSKELEIPMSASPTNNIPWNEIVDFFNKTTNGYLGKIRLPFSDKRKASVRARINDYGLETFYDVIRKAAASRFLTGDNKQNWAANFDWIIRPTNFEKVMSGNYDNKNEDTESGFEERREKARREAQNNYTPVTWENS